VGNAAEDLPLVTGRGLNACVFGASGGIGAALVAELAARGDVAVVHAGSRKPGAASGKVLPFAFDLLDEASVQRAAVAIGTPLDLVIVATGALSFPGGTGPERSVRAIDAARMGELLAINTIGPALIAKHVLPLLPREGRSVFAALSARVGSIGDNRLGGWHSYRASKAALNMLLRNFAIELSRTHREAVVAALHPGTVDTALSAPFQRRLREGQLQDAAASAAALLTVIDGLRPEDSGGFFAFDGKPIEF